MTSGPIDKVTMKMVAAMPASVRSALHPSTSRWVERWSPLRWLRNRRADVFLLWFPKTGGTWARLMMHTAICRHFDIAGAAPLELEPLADLDPRVPRLRPFHDDAPHWKRPEQLRDHKERYRGRRVLLLVRDPRDAIVSLHLQVTKRWKVDPDMTLDEFVWRDRGSLRTMIRFYNIWAACRDVPAELLLVRYEDVHADPEGELRRMLDFVGLPEIDDATVAEAVAVNRIDELREREKRGQYSSRRLKPGDAADPDSFKARRGKIGGFVDYLRPEDVAETTRMIERELDPWYGYPWPVPID